MGRNKKRSRRDFTTPIATRSVLGTTHNPSFVPYLTLFEDRRRFHPDGRFFSPAASFQTKRQSLEVYVGKPSKMTASSPPRFIQYGDSKNVLTCVRRRIRREVIHALKKNGKGVSRKKPRITWRSKIVCGG